jgi:butyrate kinase
MRDGKYMVLAINPGSTSIKIALYQDEDSVAEKNLQIKMMEIVNNFQSYTMNWDSEPVRLIRGFLEDEGVFPEQLDMVVARGGPAPPMKSGAYTVNRLFVNTFRYEPLLKHPSILGPEMAYVIAGRVGIPGIVYDADSVDEADEMEHLTGLPEIRRTVTSHNLNGKLMCLRLAKELGIAYQKAKFIVLHLGGGISVSAHKNGRVIDSAFVNDGPMTPTRTGVLPVRQLITLCYSGKYTYDEMKKFIISRGGLMAWFGTSDAVEIEKRIAGGDEKAKLVYNAMAYQVAKCVGQMAVALYGEVDAILMTGGLAHSKLQTALISERVRFIAPIHIYPGEDEMRALAHGALRVLRQEEPVREYDLAPAGYANVQEFYKKYNIDDIDARG